MCNEMRSDIKSIDLTGFGYKIFRKTETGGLKGAFSNESYIFSGDWIIWKDICKYEDGFCFLLDKETTIDLLNILKIKIVSNPNLVIHKIEYKMGLGKQKESFYYCNYIHGLCRKFKVLEEINV